MQFLEDPFNLFSRPKLIRINWGFRFSGPGKISRTSSMPPYGVAHQQFIQTIRNLSFTPKRIN
ncbi:hypothetical protein GZB42_004266 [Salmonella enterica]|nr:hypothetical protein [Salmonella enterica]ECN5336751.1 hypothetical protein [Salmonella enterica subsp. enterica serovar Give]EEH2895506.1 hypothetical protein [Salmonella enterica]EEL0431184.1 hypothetical protein [Salmonella enterica]